MSNECELTGEDNAGICLLRHEKILFNRNEGE